MGKKEKKEIPQDKIERYERLVQSIPELEIKTNFGFPYTSLNGHMFSLLSKSGYVGIRLPKEEREQFLEKYNSTLYQPEPGPLLKEYVTVPNELLNDTEELKHS
ncbi:TfoX/Sxy family protein [Fulvivirga sp. M361]|uniref:TfoX/Sxy family protein n=1 Tax=Fulvivirga sp. M361 TaxID=2594266 RepID=UPI00117BCCE5|nr:TfoX/Sxy family protein [Fulvivirga sp. M361]TRX60725.1 TfoX/Sxy family protein [Fulvivirga sp. M361]